jgi:hypothetical protein
MALGNADFRSGVPRSRTLLERGMGGKSPLREFLDPLAIRDVVSHTDDFVVLGDGWATNASTGGTAFALDSSSPVGSVTGSTGDAANNVVEIHSTSLALTGSQNPKMEARLKLDVVTNVIVEVGLQEAQADELTVAVTNWSTPALNSGISDAVLFSFNTGATQNAAFTKGSASGQTTRGASVAFPFTAGNYVRLGVQVVGKTALFFVNGERVAQIADVTNGIVNGTVPLRAVVRVQTLNTTGKSATIDYVMLVADR